LLTFIKEQHEQNGNWARDYLDENQDGKKNIRCSLQHLFLNISSALHVWAQTEAQEVPSEHEEELLPSEGDGALEQAAQRGLWSLLLWRYSRPAWTRSCAAYCR